MASKPPSLYTQEEVAVWLNSVGLGAKIDDFKANAIDGAMLVTLSAEDLTGDLGFSNLQARKFSQSLDFAKSLAASGGTEGGADPEYTKDLEEEVERLKNEIASLRLINKQLHEQLSGGTPQYAPAPAPPPQEYRAPAPAPQRYAPAPAPQQHRAGAPVIKGAAGGALRGATIGAIGGAIAGDPAKGAAMGAAMGAAGGGLDGLAARRRQRLRGR
jgi:hypothetical protein